MFERQPQPQTAHEYRQLLLSLLGSLTLADHLGDVADDVDEVLRRLGLEVEWDGDWSLLGQALHRLGVKTLYGTILSSDDEETADE